MVALDFRPSQASDAGFVAVGRKSLVAEVASVAGRCGGRSGVS